MLTHVTAIRYVTPLREGGSLPGLMEADDLGTYVVKFHGAGQGRKVLVAEIICGELARALGLPVPELVTIDVDPALATSEPDQEVQDLLRASPGLNLGMDFLPGALDYDPAAFPVEETLAGRILWFDAYIGNVDRSWRNPNLLYWHGRPQLIDHGSALTFHHSWAGRSGETGRPSAASRAYDARDHLLVGYDADVDAADAELAHRLDEATIAAAVDAVPARWLDDEPGFDSAEQVRAAYVDHLRARLDARESWLPGLREAVAGRGRDRTVRRGRPAWLAEWRGDSGVAR